LSGDLDTVIACLEQGVPVDARDHLGRTALDLAATMGRTEVFNYLLEHGADPAATDDQGSSVLASAAFGAELSVVQTLLARSVDVNGTGDATCPLEFAAIRNRVDIARVLLDAGALVPAGSANCAPLHSAVLFGRMEVLELLIERGAAVDTPNGDGDTPLHMAAHKKRADFVRWLLAHGADPAARNHRGRTPVDIARGTGDAETIAALGGKPLPGPGTAPATLLPLDSPEDEAVATVLDSVIESIGQAHWKGTENVFGFPVCADETQRVELTDLELNGETIPCRGAMLIDVLEEFTDESEQHHRVRTRAEDGTACEFRGKVYVFSGGAWGILPPGTSSGER
jgi:ankyrin repeat protein